MSAVGTGAVILAAEMIADPADAARYSPNEDRWYPLAPMPEPRIGASAIDANGVILIVGGKTGPSGNTMATSLLAYDATRDVWHVRLPSRNHGCNLPSVRSEMAPS